jgi:hypothetical protein
MEEDLLPKANRGQAMSSVDSVVGGTYQDGRIVLDRPVHWADGTRVMVQLLPEGHLTEGVWPDDGSPEGDAEILKRMEAFAAEEVSPEEAEAFAAALREAEQFNRECFQRQREKTP